MSRKFEIRCPIYGFIELDEWERDIVNHWVFQRLRRIRQLGWTDYVYPGAMHTRFEHSLGVMHMATMLFDNLVARSEDQLLDYVGNRKEGLQRSRVLVRLTALLHDVGHAPFSHAAEDVMPLRSAQSTKHWKHEHYSAAAIRSELTDVIDGHRHNHFGITASEIADLIDPEAVPGKNVAWRPLVSGEIDADRMDYLLRDSYHCGIDYGHFGWQRLLNTVIAIQGASEEGFRIGIHEGGWNAAESLFIARYMMYNQVYFHKTRVILDAHYARALKAILPKGQFPPPSRIRKYLEWDDWRVLGALSRGAGGEHGKRLCERDLYKLAWESEPYPVPGKEEPIQAVRAALAPLGGLEISSTSSWYKFDDTDIPVLTDNGKVVPLSKRSPIVGKIAKMHQIRFYVQKEKLEEAKKCIMAAVGGQHANA